MTCQHYVFYLRKECMIRSLSALLSRSALNYVESQCHNTLGPRSVPLISNANCLSIYNNTASVVVSVDSRLVAFTLNTLSAEPFLPRRERNRVKSLLSMRKPLLWDVSNPGQLSIALLDAILIFELKARFWPSLSQKYDARAALTSLTGLTSPESWTTTTWKTWHDFCRASLVCPLLNTWLAKLWTLIFIQRLFSLSASFGFNCPPKLVFKTARLELRGLDLGKSDVIYSH